MRITFMLLFLGFVTVVRASAEPIVIDTLRSPSTYTNGLLTVRGVDLGVRSASADVALTEPVKITMQMRRVAHSGKPGHFGLNVIGGDHYRAHFYSHDGRNFIAALHQEKTLIPSGMTRGAKEMFPVSGDAEWVKVEVHVQPRLAEIHIAGMPSGRVFADLLPITHLSFYGYHMDIEVKDLAWERLPEAEAVSTDPDPSFALLMDDGFHARTADGIRAPLQTVNVERDAGLSGQAVKFDALEPGVRHPSPKLEYDVEGCFANHGTVMFWVKSDWDGRYSGPITHYPMLTGYDADGREKLSIRMTWWVSAVLGRAGELRSEELRHQSRDEWFRGDWNHVAVVWSEGGWSKLFFNGLPYTQPFGDNGKLLTNLDLKSVSRLVIGSGMGNPSAEAAFDVLQVYKRPLDNGEVYDEYRRFMPVDMLMSRSHIVADAAETVELLVAPGGHYMHPIPADRPLMTGAFHFHVRVVDTNDHVVAEKDFHVSIDEPVSLRVPVGGLPAGDYRVTSSVRSEGSTTGIQRTFMLNAYHPRLAMTPSEDEIELGNVIFEKDLSADDLLVAGVLTKVESPIGSYHEGGDRPMNRFSFEVPFDEKYRDGRPVMLELVWPDDKPRSMGWYMYPRIKQNQHRDRLGGGIQSGEEFPLSGAMQTSRYLFHPGTETYLFEARTMINGYPAALAAFRVYEIKDGRLPALRVMPPDNLPGRRFGFRDEDETFDQNLGWDYEDRRDVQVMTERLLDYLDYTGQNAWQYPFMRYTGYGFDMLGARRGLYPYNVSAYPYMVEALGRRGVTTIADINLFTLPEMKLLPDQTDAMVARGWALTKVGDPPVRPNAYTRPNHANPEIRAMIARHVAETARRFQPLDGFGGIAMTTHKIGFYPSIDYGCDPFTVAQFSRETGIVVPEGTESERKAYLCDPARMEAWASWRTAQSVALFTAIREAVDAIDPALPFYVNVPATPDPEQVSAIRAVQAIDRVSIVPMRYYTDHRHNLHWGRPMDELNERLYNPDEARMMMNNGMGFVDSYPRYFESFNGSLKNDVYASYFQNADVKPFGRHFLKELAFAVSAMDAQRILIGAQALGTWGRDAVTREFARAYRALPALPFDDAPGTGDPVTVRVLNTDSGTYVYAVSMLWDDCDVTLTLDRDATLEDRSTGARLEAGTIRLQAYQLRTFKSTDPELRIPSVAVRVSPQAEAWARAQVDDVRRAVERLEAGDIACEAAQQALGTMTELLSTGRYAELHRVLFSVGVRDAVDKARNYDNYAEQAAMIRRGHYAVNCGSTEFLRTRQGVLFFPDQPFAKGGYGHEGPMQTVNRSIDGVEHDQAELFITEAYSFDAYRFTVEPGTYDVTLYLKAGFARNFKSDAFVFSVTINGRRVLDDFDVVSACDNDFTRVAIQTFPSIVVEGNEIEIRFLADADRSPSVKLANAIEIIRQGD